MRDGTPVIRHVGLVYQSGPCPARAVAEQGRVRQARLCPAEAARRGSGPPPPRPPRRGADEDDRRTGPLPGRLAGWTLQAGPLSLLRPGKEVCRIRGEPEGSPFSCGRRFGSPCYGSRKRRSTRSLWKSMVLMLTIAL